MKKQEKVMATYDKEQICLIYEKFLQIKKDQNPKRKMGKGCKREVHRRKCKWLLHILKDA